MTEPCGVVDAPVLAEVEDDQARINRIAEIDGKRQGEQEAVATDALEEVCPDHVVKRAGAAHA